MEPPTKSVLAPPRHPNPLKNVYKAKQIKQWRTQDIFSGGAHSIQGPGGGNNTVPVQIFFMTKNAQNRNII